MHTKEPSGAGTAERSWLQPKFSILYSLKTPTQPTLVFHWSLLTLTQCLFFIGHGLHPRDSCFSLVTFYIHAILVFHWSWFTPTQCWFSIGYSLPLRIPCFRQSFCWFYLRPNVSVNNICRVHRDILQMKRPWYTEIKCAQENVRDICHPSSEELKAVGWQQRTDTETTKWRTIRFGRSRTMKDQDEKINADRLGNRNKEGAEIVYNIYT